MPSHQPNLPFEVGSMGLLLPLKMNISATLAGQPATDIFQFLIPSSVVTGTRCLSGFYVSGGDLNIGPQVCTASTLPPEPFS